MSRKDLDKAFEIIEVNKKAVDTVSYLDSYVVSEAEKLLKVSFPDSYKSFLKKFGFLGFHSLEIYGILDSELEKGPIPNGIWLTLDERKIVSLPVHYVLIAALGDGAYYALDTSRMNNENECPVVLLDYVHGEEPVDVAEDFGKFLLDQLEEALEYRSS